MANTALASTNQARKKGGTRLGAVYAEKLPLLSPEDEKGVEALIHGSSATDAWTTSRRWSWRSTNYR